MASIYARGVTIVLGLAVGMISSVPSHTQNTPPPQSSPQQGIAFTMGKIGERTSYGRDGDWLTTASKDGSLVLSSQSDPHSTSDPHPSWTAAVVPAPAPPYAITVQMHHEFAPVEGHAVGAGVLFGLQRGSQPKFCAALLAGDTLCVYSYDGGFAKHLTITSPHSAAQFDTLGVAVRNDGVTLTLNTNRFNIPLHATEGSIKLDCSSTGEFGVMASGRGTVTFRNLNVQ